MKKIENFLNYYYHDNQPIKTKMNSQLQETIPRLPANIVKYIASFIPSDAEYIISIFKAFSIGVETDDKSTQHYKKIVVLYLSRLIENTLDEVYALSDETNDIELSPYDLFKIYEVTYADHYYQTYGGNDDYLYSDKTKHIHNEFLECTQLMEEETSLCYNEKTMGKVYFPINIKDLKYFSLLEKCLLERNSKLLKFIYKHMYSPIMAFYLYIKHNHTSYRNHEKSLANDDWLLKLIVEDNHQKELLALAIGGLFLNTIYVGELSKSKIVRSHMVLPNLEVVKKIIGSNKGLSHELIPFYLNSGEQFVTPLHYWKNYKNTFTEKIFTYKSVAHQEVTIHKNKLIGEFLLAQTT